jgi:uncharacterized protein (UPF0147 family)
MCSAQATNGLVEASTEPINEEENLEQAVVLLDQIVAQAPMSRELHIGAQEAIDLLRKRLGLLYD